MTVSAASYSSARGRCRAIAARGPVGPVERLDQHLDRLADLIAELVGDLLLVRGTLGQHRLERLAVGHEKNRWRPAGCGTPAGSAAPRARGCVPRGEAGRLPLGASTSIHRSPLVTRPSRIPVAWSSSIIRVAGEPSTARPWSGFSRFWVADTPGSGAEPSRSPGRPRGW